MKKNILFLFLIIISIKCYSQQNIQKTDTILNKKCSVKSEYDKFNKTTLYKTGMSLYIGSGMTIDLMRFSSEDNTKPEFYFINASTLPSGCLTKDSYVSFLLEDESVITFRYDGEISCGSYSGTFPAKKEDFEALIKNKITDIRVYFDHRRDLKVNEKNDLKIKSYLYCILNCK